jgi:hypothetical protein
MIGQLVDACLLDVVGNDQAGQTRYRFHDLLRVFARECLLRDEARSEQHAAVGRLLVGYLAIAKRGNVALQAPRSPPAGDTKRHAPRWKTLSPALTRWACRKQNECGLP